MRGRLDEVVYNERMQVGNLDINELLKSIPLVHEDARRKIFDPSSNEEYKEFSKGVLSGLDGVWYPHNVIEISQSGLKLGDHHHDYRELFFTPTGEIAFRLVDGVTLEMRDYELKQGSRLLIPSGIDHVAVGKSGRILMGYGDAKFDKDRLIPCSRESFEALSTLSLN